MLLGGATSPPAPGVAVEIELTGLRSTKGQVMACITAVPAAFPNCDKDKNAVHVKVKADAAARFTIHAPGPGNYAVAVVHDENGNGKMDMRLFLPREGFGFSRNPKLGMGPPKFAASSFAVGSVPGAVQQVRMRYI